MSLSKEQLEWVDEYYIASITDFCDGVSLRELKEILKLYEDDGNYLACAGMKKAIDSLSEIITKEDYDT